MIYVGSVLAYFGSVFIWIAADLPGGWLGPVGLGCFWAGVWLICEGLAES